MAAALAVLATAVAAALAPPASLVAAVAAALATAVASALGSLAAAVAAAPAAGVGSTPNLVVLSSHVRKGREELVLAAFAGASVADVAKELGGRLVGPRTRGEPAAGA